MKSPRCGSNSARTIAPTVRTCRDGCRGLFRTNNPLNTLQNQISVMAGPCPGHPYARTHRALGFPQKEIESPEPTIALPERRVTVHSGHMGNTIGAFAEAARCSGRCLTPWMNTDEQIVEHQMKGNRQRTHTNFLQAVLGRRHWQTGYDPAALW